MTRRVVSSSFQRFMGRQSQRAKGKLTSRHLFHLVTIYTLPLSPRSATLKKSFPFLAEAQAINRMKFHLAKPEREHREDS